MRTLGVQLAYLHFDHGKPYLKVGVCSQGHCLAGAGLSLLVLVKGNYNTPAKTKQTNKKNETKKDILY